VNDRDDDSRDEEDPADVQSEIAHTAKAYSKSEEPEDEQSDGQIDHEWGWYFAGLFRILRASRFERITSHCVSEDYGKIKDSLQAAELDLSGKLHDERIAFYRVLQRANCNTAAKFSVHIAIPPLERSIQRRSKHSISY
jgi:hypothetical protein